MYSRVSFTFSPTQNTSVQKTTPLMNFLSLTCDSPFLVEDKSDLSESLFSQVATRSLSELVNVLLTRHLYPASPENMFHAETLVGQAKHFTIKFIA